MFCLRFFERASSKAWNKAGKKHPMYAECQTREYQFDRERDLAERRRRREKVEAVVEPVKACGRWFCEHGLIITLLLIAVLFFVGWTVMTCLFLFYPFPSAPPTLPHSEFFIPSDPFLNSFCVVHNGFLNAGVCRGNYPSGTGFFVLLGRICLFFAQPIEQFSMLR